MPKEKAKQLGKLRHVTRHATLTVTNSNSEFTFLEPKEKKEEYEFSEILADVRRTSLVEDEVVLILFNSIVGNIVESCKKLSFTIFSNRSDKSLLTEVVPMLQLEGGALYKKGRGDH
uniref:Uncharacterized protein n=1 Tax=Timema poppense TaxID=170557 RepID=A0A7R9CM05_TIMPO|nr:unnamed protein product [Timema poppensis]